MPDPSHLLIARVHGVAGRHEDLRAAADFSLEPERAS
jgi:hypothetical protein